MTLTFTTTSAMGLRMVCALETKRAAILKVKYSSGVVPHDLESPGVLTWWMP